ncbi:MAG: hypothetical protein M8353_11470 [ANME-2 cluster archaeon]|nr:hypothetical protein [ANME-2 cluster archaeon]
MKITEHKNMIIIALAICVIIVVGFFTPLQETKGVHIITSIGIGQGSPVNDTQNESVTVNGSFVNDGDKPAEDFTATVIYTDVAHDKVFSEIVTEGVDLLPNKELTVDFESEYIRERTEPKTVVNVTVRLDWKENGELKTLSIGD